MKKDDSNISDASLRNVRKHADLVLRRADALDRLPTPVYDVIAAAKLEISRENIFDAVYLGGLYRRLSNTVKLAPETLKRALGKVLGVLDREERVIHLDGSLHEKKKKFLSIHEVGHDILPWQQKTFSFLEDSEQELDPGTHDLYEREANCFASEVMFQLDKFAAIAEDFAFGIRAPLDLSGKFGSSFYAAARRYVTTRRREACVLAVFERPVQIIEKGERMRPRRVIPSPMFCARLEILSVASQNPCADLSPKFCYNGRSLTYWRCRHVTLANHPQTQHE